MTGIDRLLRRPGEDKALRLPQLHFTAPERRPTSSLRTMLSWHLADLAPYVIATTSILNAMFESADQVVSDMTLAAYLPHALAHYHPVMSLVADHGDERAWDARVAAALRHHNSLVDRTRRFATDESDFSVRAGIDADELLREWRGHCADVNEVLSYLAQQVTVAGDRSETLLRQLMAELAQASEGHWPSVIGCDKIRLVRAGELRRSPRWPVVWDAELRSNAATIDIQIRDVSVSGFGFSMDSDGSAILTAAIGNLLKLRFAGGRQLAVRLIWTNGPRGGGAFEQGLSDGDPLLKAARAMAALV